MVTLIHINRLVKTNDLPSIQIVFVQSTTGTLPQEKGIDFYQWYYQIKAEREALTEMLNEEN